MREYALIMLIMLEYACLYLNKQFWICQSSESVLRYIVKGHCTNYWAVIETEAYPSTVKHLRWSVLQIEHFIGAGTQPEIFQGKKVSWN